MTGLACQATVLVVDDDLGFIFWLGEIFHEIGCNVVPALDCARAISTVNDLNLRVDVMVVNYRLPGIPEMISALRTAGRTLKIVAIADSPDDANLTPADAILIRPSGWERVSRTEWLERVQEIVRGVRRTGTE